MLSFKQRNKKKELLDGDDIPFPDIVKNLKELNIINTYLGGHKISIDGFRNFIKNKNPLTILEIGCGGGDNLVAIQKYARTQNISLKLMGLDYNESMITFINQNHPEIETIYSSVDKTVLPIKPDIIFSSLFCHHFSNEELIQQVQWMKENSKLGFFINDLHRHPLAYFSIKCLTQLFSKSYLVKNDAPLSVARGFIKKDWLDIFKAAHISSCQIQWKWAFRHLIIFRHEC